MIQHMCGRRSRETSNEKQRRDHKQRTQQVQGKGAPQKCTDHSIASSQQAGASGISTLVMAKRRGAARAPRGGGAGPPPSPLPAQHALPKASRAHTAPVHIRALNRPNTQHTVPITASLTAPLQSVNQLTHRFNLYTSC
jgi:hypothetical protein